MIFRKLGDDARIILPLANQTALEMQNEHVAPLHVAVALLRRPEGNAGMVLQNLGVNNAEMLRDLRSQLRSGGLTSGSKLPCLPATRELFDVAVQEASRLGHSLVGTLRRRR